MRKSLEELVADTPSAEALDFLRATIAWERSYWGLVLADQVLRALGQLHPDDVPCSLCKDSAFPCLRGTVPRSCLLCFVGAKDLESAADDFVGGIEPLEPPE